MFVKLKLFRKLIIKVEDEAVHIKGESEMIMEDGRFDMGFPLIVSYEKGLEFHKELLLAKGLEFYLKDSEGTSTVSSTVEVDAMYLTPINFPRMCGCMWFLVHFFACKLSAHSKAAVFRVCDW